MDILSPQSTSEVVDAIASAAAVNRKLEIRGGGGKARFGAPREAAILDMRGLSGVIDYDPAELVLTAWAGTPLADIRRLVAGQGQMLAFDPWDSATLYGGEEGASTIGGVVAAGVAGPGRISGGAARDHVLGFEAVSGRGESFIAGAKVVKNVTGYDLSKLMTGSWGRLAALTRINLKVLPQPPVARTIALHGLEDGVALSAMSAALGSPAEVAAAAHLSATAMDGEALTVLRLQGVEPSVRARSSYLMDMLGSYGACSPLSDDDAGAIWDAVRRVSALAASPVLWRVIVPPSRAVTFTAGLEGAAWLFDWGGNLVWVGGDVSPQAVREGAERAGGHATLVRCGVDADGTIPALHPRPAPIAALEARMRRAFDPAGLFESGRFSDMNDAD